MRIILPLVLVCMIAAGGFGLVLLKKNLGTADGTLDPGNESAFGTALSMIVQDLTGQGVIKAEGDLRGFVPAPPEGWTMRPYETADGFAITNEQVIRTPISKSTTNDTLQAFERDMGSRKLAEAITYVNGDLMISLRMRLLDQINERTVRGGIMAAIGSNMSASFGSSAPITPGLFAKLDGVEFIQRPRFSRRTGNQSKMPVVYRTFAAKIGPAVQIQLITNAADTDVAAILSQIDVAGINAILPQPAPEFREGIGWLLASTEPLSDIPPGPSLATKAFAILNDGRIYSAGETETLADIADGSIIGWDKVDRDIAPTDNLIAILGPEPQTRVVRRVAEAMSQAGNLSGSMKSLVDDIARGRITSQAGLYTHRDFRGLVITPEFRSLMGMLPVGEVDTTDLEANSSAATTAPENTGPVIRRGVKVMDGLAPDSSCTIELGVRRCVLSDDG